MDPKPKLNYNSFESIVLSVSHPNWKTLQPVLFVIVRGALIALEAPGLWTFFEAPPPPEFEFIFVRAIRPTFILFR